MSDIKHLFAANLKRLRESAGLTQAELGIELGQSASYINQLESGKKGFTAESLEKYSDLLKVPYSEFFRKEEIEIVDGIRTFFLALDTFMKKMKESRSKLLKEKNEMSEDEYQDGMEANDEIIGRLGLLRASVEDHFKFFFGFETSIFTRKKPRLKNYSLVFNLFKEARFDIEKTPEGEVWKVKPDYLNGVLKAESEEEMLKKTGPSLDQEKQELIALVTKLDNSLVPRATDIIKGLRKPASNQGEDGSNAGSGS